MAVTKEDVKNSMQCKFLKYGTKYAFIGLAIVELIMFICIIVQAEDFKSGLLQFVVVFVMANVFMAIPFLIYFAMYRSIVNKYERYDVYEVLLDKPKRVWAFGHRGGYAYCYNITFTTKSNQVVTTKTKALWSDGAFSIYDKRDYDQGRIKILYDEKTGKVVVLGR